MNWTVLEVFPIRQKLSEKVSDVIMIRSFSESSLIILDIYLFQKYFQALKCRLSRVKAIGLVESVVILSHTGLSLERRDTFHITE